jgi:hypothetical protein
VLAALERWSPARRRAIAWGVFALEVVFALGWAARSNLQTPLPEVSGAIVNGARFGKTEPERRAMYQELVRGEPGDRAAAEARSETTTWNRNHDAWFHQLEYRRIYGVAARLRIPAWEAYLIMDEGMRAHWPPPAGVSVYEDDHPLARTTRPIAQHRLIASGN